MSGYLDANGALITCPTCGTAWASCPCSGAVYTQRLFQAKALDEDAKLSRACPRGHETAVRKRGSQRWCGLCGATW